MSDFAKVILGGLSSAAFLEFIQFLINRHDKKKGVLAELKKDFEDFKKQILDKFKEQKKRDQKVERDNCRTQLLLLISDFPEERQEALTLAKHYFVDLEGDWYATSIFHSYLQKNGIPIPPWFNANHHTGK